MKKKGLFDKITFALIITMMLVLNLFAVNVLLVQARGAVSITVKVSYGGTVQVYTQKKMNWNLIETITGIETIKIPGNKDEVRFALIPDSGYHVSAVKQDTDYIPFGDPRLTETSTDIYDYTLELIDNQYTLEVTFSEIGTAVVPENSIATVFLGSSASLSVDNTGNPAITFEGIELFNLLNSFVVWNITTNQETGLVTVVLKYTFEEPEDETVHYSLKLFRSDFTYPNADVNDDDEINGEDVSIVGGSNPSDTNSENWNQISYLDINGDGKIDDEDVNIVSQYNPTPTETIWIDITDYISPGVPNIVILSPTQGLISGTTDHFCLFRCR